jgi:hypothetical protein
LVRDTFGRRHGIESCAKLDGTKREWRFFELTGDSAGEWLMLPRTLPAVTQPADRGGRAAARRGREPRLGRGAADRERGCAHDRPRGTGAAAMPSPEPPPGRAWRYKLTTPVPEHQVPLVPVTSNGGLYLQRGRLATEAGDGVTTRGAVGRILEPGRQLLIHDEEVPATGARVTRTWQMARTAGGDVVLWVGRRKRAGRPLKSPGLRFDEVER